MAIPGLDEFDDDRQRAKVAAGFKGGPFFMNPVEVPARHFEDGVPDSVKQVIGNVKITEGSVTDPWVYRTGKNK